MRDHRARLCGRAGLVAVVVLFTSSHRAASAAVHDQAFGVPLAPTAARGAVGFDDCNENGIDDLVDVQPGDIKRVTLADLELAINHTLILSSAHDELGTGPVYDVNVEIDATHTNVGDLQVFIRHGLQTVQLMRFGTCPGWADLAGTAFDDEGADGLIGTSCSSGMVGRFRPDQPLFWFDGLDKQGIWELVIVDPFAANDGVLHGWTLEFANAPALSLDCNEDGVPDECQLAGNDCNNNGVPDDCDPDCNGNGVADDCDIAAETSDDCQLDGVPDECEVGLSLEEALANLSAGSGAITSLIADLFEFLEGETGDAIFDGGMGMYNFGNILNTNRMTQVPYTNGAVVPGDDFFGPGSRYATAKYPGLFVLMAEGVNIDSFYTTGTTGTNGFGIVDVATLESTAHGRHTVFVKRISAGGDPSINHLIVVPGYRFGLTHLYPVNTLLDIDQIIGLGSVPRLYYLLVSRVNGLPLSDADALAVADAFLAQARLGTDCNSNGLPDDCDSFGAGADCDGNLVPDECEPDCNDNGVTDACDISNGTSQDCQENGIPDDCELDDAAYLYAVYRSDHRLERMTWPGGDFAPVGALRGSADSLYAFGLSRDPLYGDLYALAEFPDEGGGALLPRGGSNLQALVRLHPETGEATGIGVVSYDGRLSDIAFRADGRLYGIAGANAPVSGELFLVNRNDASLASTGLLLGGGGGQSIAFQPGTGLLYHAVNNRLDAVNVDSGSVTTIDEDAPSLQALTFHPDTGQLIGFSFGNLLELDPASGDDTILAGISANITGLAFLTVLADCNGNGVPDGCEISSGAESDCQPNGVPDSCEIDCNGNGRPDLCDLVGDKGALYADLVPVTATVSVNVAADDLHFAAPGLMNSFDVGYYNLNTYQTQAVVEFFTNNPADDPSQDFASIIALQLRLPPSPGGLAHVDLFAPLPLPADVWMDVQIFDANAGLRVSTSAPTAGSSHDLYYDRTLGEVLDFGGDPLANFVLAVNARLPGASADANADGVPDECEGACVCGDLDGDGFVNLVDFITLSVCFNLPGPNDDCPAGVYTCADLSADGAVNLVDFITFSTIFNLDPGGVSPPDCLEIK